MPSDTTAFEPFVARVRAVVEAELAAGLEARVAAAKARGAGAALVAEALRALVLRGGKRMRAVLLVAGYEACGGAGGAAAVAGACAALELLQAYLLVHDDWMDGDEVRRGGPSVPAMLRAQAPEHADALSILAGDLACAWAQESLLACRAPAEHLVGAARELARVQDQVVAGQIRDVRSGAGDAREVELTHALKTASYTVRGPVVMGGLLAGASDAHVAALAAYGEPLGVAFQLRDDVLGTFGDERATGKPSGGDLRRGKRTALVVEAGRDERAAAAIARVAGQGAGATAADVADAVAAIEASGARGRVEARIAELVRAARAALERAPLTPAGKAPLLDAVTALTARER
jgi:geranylgeranyl diphosphate synthase type I